MKSPQEYYRELIIDLIPLDDNLAANGASMHAIECFRAMIDVLQEDYEAQYGEKAWWR